MQKKLKGQFDHTDWYPGVSIKQTRQLIGWPGPVTSVASTQLRFIATAVSWLVSYDMHLHSVIFSY